MGIVGADDDEDEVEAEEEVEDRRRPCLALFAAPPRRCSSPGTPLPPPSTAGQGRRVSCFVWLVRIIIIWTDKTNISM